MSMPTTASKQQLPSSSHNPKFHEAGWTISIETPNGIIGFWSCWRKDRFFLGYPKDILSVNDVDQIIINTLEVEIAKPVLHVSETAINSKKHLEADNDKPLEKKGNYFLAYKEQGLRCWAKFYGPINNGRVWVDHSNSESNCIGFDTICNHQINTVQHGYNLSQVISTYQFDRFNKYAPEGPTTRPEAIQQYRDKFLVLACKITELLGGAQAINTNYGYLIEEEQQLLQLGYENISRNKSPKGHYWEDVVIANKTTGDNKETIALTNRIVNSPYITIRRVTCKNITPEKIIEYLTF